MAEVDHRLKKRRTFEYEAVSTSTENVESGAFEVSRKGFSVISAYFSLPVFVGGFGVAFVSAAVLSFLSEATVGIGGALLTVFVFAVEVSPALSSSETGAEVFELLGASFDAKSPPPKHPAKIKQKTNNDVSRKVLIPVDFIFIMITPNKKIRKI